MDIYWDKAGRRFLRVLSAIVLIFYVVYRICIPLVSGKVIHLDSNDGYIIMGAIAMLICIEVWVAFLKKFGNYAGDKKK
jgi:hypothetical protein